MRFVFVIAQKSQGARDQGVRDQRVRDQLTLQGVTGSSWGSRDQPGIY